MKKSCTGCRAYGNSSCELGYNIKPTKEFNNIIVSSKSTENCPKPTTYDNLIYLSEMKMKGLSKEELNSMAKL